MAELWASLPGFLGPHVLLVVVSIGVAVVVSLPLAVLALNRKWLRGSALGAASLVQTVPGIALLALCVAVLIVIKRSTGAGFEAIGLWPTLIALSLYAVLPVLRNAVVGLEGVDPSTVEAARGLGMTPGQVLTQVRLPLAAPVILAGVRTATVWTVGLATLSTPVGQNSLGNYIFTGLQTFNIQMVVFGCLSAAALAIALDGLLAAATWGMATRRRWAVAAAGVALALVLVGGLVLWMTEPFAVRRDTVGGGVVEEGPRRQLVVGSKTFAESFTLAELMHRRLDPHFDVDHRTGLGSAVAFQALAAGELDAYVDYTGTLWTNVLGHDHLPPPGTMIYPMASELAARHGITVLGPLGFENAYAFAVRPELAQRLNATTISELAPHTDQLSIGSDPEFFGRPEWPALQQTYGLAFANERGMQSVLMYPAAAEGEVDVITAYTTDGGIARYGLTVLPDNEQALPPYDAVILLSSEAAEDPRVLAALRPLIHAMDLAMMQRANAMVDLEGGTPTEAAAWLDEQLLDAATGSSPP